MDYKVGWKTIYENFNIITELYVSFNFLCLKIKLTRLISKMYIHSYEFKEFNAIKLQTKINLLFLLHIITNITYYIS